MHACCDADSGGYYGRLEVLYWVVSVCMEPCYFYATVVTRPRVGGTNVLGTGTLSRVGLRTGFYTSTYSYCGGGLDLGRVVLGDMHWATKGMPLLIAMDVTECDCYHLIFYKLGRHKDVYTCRNLGLSDRFH